MNEIEAFRASVEKYITAHGMTPTAFGKKFAGDPLFVFQLRESREPRTETRKRILERMQGQAEPAE